MKIIKVCYHGNCFDGVSSASVFSCFYREVIISGQPDWEFAYQSMMHRAGTLFDDEIFDGDENAIVDFKYSNSPKLTWWFDHHKSAFLSRGDEEHFKADTSGKKFLDPSYKSCTKLIADIAQKRFGFDAAPMSDLIHWANIIDGALYKTPAEPVEMKDDALKLAMVIESDRNQQLIAQIIQDLQVKTLKEVAASPYIVERIDPLYLQHLRAIKLIRETSSLDGPVVFFDVADYGREMEGYNKFIPYYLYPESTYSVSVSHSNYRSKVSVGSNPWSPHPRKHDLAKICERYGGGGHAVVAAISIAPEQLDEARRIAREIVQELKT
jgi:hypothetical protein